MSRTHHFGLSRPAGTLVPTDNLGDFRTEVRDLADLLDQLWALDEEERAEADDLVDQAARQFKSLGRQYG